MPTRDRRAPIAKLTTLLGRFVLATALAMPTIGQEPDPPRPTPTPSVEEPAKQEPTPTPQPVPQPGQRPTTEKPAATGEGESAAKPQQPNAGQPTKAEPPPPPNRAVLDFTTPDGSRFVLVADRSLPMVEWVVASWADGRDDPDGLPGVAMAAARASLAGTWATGSKDPEAEREALAALDEAWQQQLAGNDPRIGARIVQLDKAAAALADERMFERVLAAAPADRPTVTDRDGIAMFRLTTIEAALPRVAQLLLERREQQALRGLARSWMPELVTRMQRHAQAPHRQMLAEVLALLMPFAPAADRLQPPVSRAPTRAQALTSWRRSQHPTRTVHVLLGGFDPSRVRDMLKQVFVETTLGEPPVYRQPPMRAFRSERRSVVPGMPDNRTYFAWVLPKIDDQFELALATAWLDTAPASPLLRKMSRTRPGIQFGARAPWPLDAGGRGLLLLEVIDPSGKPGLVDEVLATCRECATEQLRPGNFWVAHKALQSDWIANTGTARQLAMAVAERTLLWPDEKVHIAAPRFVQHQKAQAILQRAFSFEPAIVESKR